MSHQHGDFTSWLMSYLISMGISLKAIVFHPPNVRKGNHVLPHQHGDFTNFAIILTHADVKSLPKVNDIYMLIKGTCLVILLCSLYVRSGGEIQLTLMKSPF